MVQVIEDPQGNLLIERGEYSAVLPAEQTVNHSNVEKYFEDVYTRDGVSEEKINQMLDNLLRQPIMASVYRKNKIKPEQVDDFIENVTHSSPHNKGDLITQFWTAYGTAAHSEFSEVEGKLKVEGKEWNAVEVGLNKPGYLSANMRKFNTSKEVPAATKLSFAQKVKNCLGFVRTKKMSSAKTIDTGFCDASRTAPMREAVKVDQKQMSFHKDPKINS